MENVLLVAYLLIVLAMIAVILLQRSEGGGLGMGGGNAFMSARGSANVLTRTTGILAALFFVLAIGLTVVKTIDQGSTSILDSANQALDTGTDGTGDATSSGSVLDALNQLQAQTSSDPSSTPIPTPTPTSTTAPAADAGSTPSSDAPTLAVPQTPDQTGTTGGN